jgi:hypothetical protein
MRESLSKADLWLCLLARFHHDDDSCGFGFAANTSLSGICAVASMVVNVLSFPG